MSRINDFLASKEKFFINQYQIETLLENIPQIIYMRDMDGEYITGTKFAKKFVEKGEDSICNIKLNRAELKEIICEEDVSVLKNNKTVSGDKEISDRRGNRHWYSIYKAPMKNFDDDIFGMVVIINNIDQPRKLETQKETFVASVGHDLKNPTIAQMRAAELLLKGQFGALNTEQNDIVQMIMDSCKYMSGMLSSLLATYRNDDGKINLHYENIELSDLVSECVGEMIYCAKEKDVEIQVCCKLGSAEVYCDRVQIRRVIMNLLSNGIKYAFKNSILKITLYREGNYTCFKFENESPYIPEGKQASIFSRYVSFASTYNEHGTGLGLYASKKIIDAHGGRIFVKSYKENKNVFGFKLPNITADKEKTGTIIF